MPILKELFGKTECDKDVYQYTLDNSNGMIAEILSYGGIIKSLTVNDSLGLGVDVVLGYDNFEDYLHNGDCFGVAVGRNSNRIENAEFEINGVKYTLEKNNENNNLHGGLVGFSKRVWDVTEKETDGEPSLVMTLVSPDGEEGFPGTVTVTMTYTLTKNNSLKINYRAISDKDTIINMTNHSYFNLSGHASGEVYDQILYLNSSFYTPNNEDCVPTGEILSVMNTPFDFRVPKPVGQDINADCEQIEMFNGYDHNLVLDGEGYRTGAILQSTQTGIVLEMKTDCPAVQIYTHNSAEEKVYKDGAVYTKHNGICFEAQKYPNATKYKHFPTTVVKAGEVYDTTTEYKFSVQK